MSLVPIEVSMRRQMLGPALTMPQIACKVATERRVSLPALMGVTRRRRIVLARWEAMRRCHEAGYSQSQIGRFFDRDHTTVAHALARVE